MTNKETVERNIGLTFDFVNQIIDKTAIADNLPEEFTLEFIEKDFPKLERKQSKDKESRVRKKLVKIKNTFDFL